MRGRIVRLVGQPTGIAMPPTRGAPAPIFPIRVSEEQRALAPVPLADRYPFIQGQSLNASYFSSVYRLCTTGYRQQYVDLLNEMREHDPHMMSVLTKRVLSTANGRLELTPPDLPKNHKDVDKAKAICEDCQARVDRIPNLTQTIAWLVWAVYYGLSAGEIFWNNSKGWSIDRIDGIHSRRLSYPDGQSWDLRIWDQGQVYGWQSPWGEAETNSGVFGLKVANYPGKFIVHSPQLVGDYPTRDGIGRQLAFWSMFKRIGGRGASSYLERFAKGFMDVSYSTGKDGKPREATKEDIDLAIQIAAGVGAGSGSLASHADSIQVNPKSFDAGTGRKLTWQEWISLCNAEMSKVVLGSTLGTEVGHGGGNRALGEVQERAEVDLEQYDATVFGQSFKRDVVSWLVRLNHPGFEHLTPNVVVHVDTDPDPKPIVELALNLTKMGLPVDGDALSETVGMPLVPNDELDDEGKPKPRRTFLPDVTAPASVDPDLLSAEAKQAEQDQTEADNAAAMAKAQQPVLPPGAVPTAPGKPPETKSPAQAPGRGPTGAQPKPPAKPAAKKLSDAILPAREAAICIVRDEHGRVLTVSRPEPPHEMALPGGHVDDGEIPITAALRELAEETGIEGKELRHVAQIASPLDGRPVHVFEVLAWTGNAHPAEPTSRVEWLLPDELLEQALLFKTSVRELMSELDPVITENLRLREVLALSDRPDRDVALEVFNQLLEDYPRQSLAWIPDIPWTGPKLVPLEAIDFEHRAEWKASHEDVTPYVERIKGGKRKPVILVRVPKNPKDVIVDGHHRTLAHEKLGWPVPAYEGVAPTIEGPWMTLHAAQKQGSSKGTASWLEKNT